MTSREKFEQGLNEYRKTTKKEVGSNSREKFEQGLNNYRKVKANTEFVDSNTQNINVYQMANERYNTPKADTIQPFPPTQTKQPSYNPQDFREQDKLKMAAYEMAKRNTAQPIEKPQGIARAGMLAKDAFTGIGQGLGNLFTGATDIVASPINVAKGVYDMARGEEYKPLINTQKWREFNQRELGLPEGAETDRQIAKGAGNMVADVAQVIGTGGIVKGAGIGANMTNKIGQKALQSGVTGGANSILNSAGDQVDLPTAAKNLARDTMFYSAGGAASGKVNEVASQLITKYGLQNKVAVELARNAIEGVAFDVGGYATTIPTYEGLGDAKPTAQEIGYDMAIGFMFDFVPGTYDTIKTSNANKVNMKANMDNFKKDYELVSQLEQSNKSNPKALDTVYDSMLRRVETARETLNNTNALGQDKQVNELRMLFDTTQREIMNKKANINTVQAEAKPNTRVETETSNQLRQQPTRINAVERTEPIATDNTAREFDATQSNIEQNTDIPNRFQQSVGVDTNKAILPTDMTTTRLQAQQITSQPTTINIGAKNNINPADVSVKMDTGLNSNIRDNNTLKIKDDNISTQPIADTNYISADIETNPKADIITDNLNIKGQSKVSAREPKLEAYSSALAGPQLRTATGTNTDIANTRKASEIYKDFSTKLGLAIKNRPQKGALGTHDPTSHLIRIGKKNDLSVLSHETGHYFDKEYQFNKIAELNSELLELGRPSSTAKYSNDRIKREGVGEFTRLYLTDNATAKELAPKMYERFTKDVDKGILKVLDGIKNDIDKFSNLSVIERAKKTISFADDKLTKEKLTDKVNGISNIERKSQEAYSAIYDRKYPLVWAAKKMAGKEKGEYIRDDISAARGYAESAEYSIKEKQTDAYNKEIGEGLESILTPILKSDEAYKDFVNYALNGRRAIDYFEKGLEFPITKAESDQVRIYNEQKYPEFKEIFDKLQTYQKNSLKQFVDIGMMSQEKYDSIMKENPNYIPGNRVVEALYKSYGSSDLSPVKKLKGGGQDFVDAIETIISNTYIHKKIVSDYMIKKDFIEIANSVEDMGNLVTKAPIKMQPTTLNMAQLEKTFTDVAKKAGISDEEIKNNLDMDFMATFFRQNVVADVNQIAFPYVDADGKDKITLYDVDPLIYSAFTRNPIMNPVVNSVIKKLSTLTKIKKAGIIFTPLYVGRNLARDTVGNLVNSRNDISAFDIGKGMVEAVTNGDIAKLARKSGAVTGFFSPDRKFVQNSIKDMQLTHKKAKNFNEAVNKLFKTTGNIAREKVMSPGEMAGRLAEFEKTIVNQYKKAYGNTLKNKQILDIVMDDPKKYRRILNRAAFNTRDITVDFNRSGGMIEDLQINRVIAFFNPALQGAEKFARNFADKDTRGRVAVKLAMTASITMAISALLEGNENYEELPDYRKDYYINIPLGDPKTATKFLPVPLQYDVAFTSLATPRRLIEHFVKKNPKAFANYTDTIEQAFMFSTMPDLLNMYIELESNKDWTGRNILNYADEGKKPYLQYGDYTSETSKAVGYMLKDIEGIPVWMKSPKQLDHVIKGQTGTMGTIALKSIDQLAGTKEGVPIFGGLANGFIIDATKNPKSINDFYENKKIIDSDYSEYEETGRKQKYDVAAVKDTFASYYKEVTKINKAIKELNDKKDTSKIEVLTKKRLELMQKANKMYEEKRNKN